MDFIIFGSLVISPLYDEEDPDTKLSDIYYDVKLSGVMKVFIEIDEIQTEEDFQSKYTGLKKDWVERLIEMPSYLQLENQNVEFLKGNWVD